MGKNPYFKRMGHVAVQVENLKEAVAFYHEVLGLDKKWLGDDDWAQVSLGDEDLSLIRRKGALHPPHIGFRVPRREDLQHLHSVLKTKGVYLEEIKLHRDATESFYFKDPDGNWLEALWDPAEEET